MTNKKLKQCKSKECYNPVLKGKYCIQCTQKRKETRDKILAGTVGVAILRGSGPALKKVGIIKQAPKIAAKAIKVIFKRG